METETESTIERVDVANGDLIDVLAQLRQYDNTNGARGTNPRIAVVGDGANRMLMPTATSNVVEDEIVYGSQLVEDGEVTDTIEIDGHEVDLNVV